MIEVAAVNSEVTETDKEDIKPFSANWRIRTNPLPVIQSLREEKNI